MPYVKVTDL